MAKKKIEFSNTVVISGKEYLIKTFVDRYNKLKSKIYYKNKIIAEKSIKIEKGKKEKELIPFIEKIHRDYIHELSLLNNLSEEEENRQNIKFLLFLGAVYFTKGLIKESKEIFKKTLKWDNNCVEAYNYLGVIALQEENIPQAIDYLKKASVLAPDVPETRIKLIDAYLLLDNMKKVDEELFRLSKKNPDYHFVYWYKIMITLKQLISGEYKENEDITLTENVIAWMKKGHNLSHEIIDESLFEKAYIDINVRNYKSALKNIQALIDTCKNSFLNKEIDNFHIILMQYKKTKDRALIKEAIDTFTEILKEKPSDAIMKNKLGILYFILAQDLLKESKSYFRDSMDTDENFVFARKNFNMTSNCIRNLDALIFDFLKQ